MDGKELKSRLINEGFKMSVLSLNMGISEQALNSKLKSKNISVSLLLEIAKNTNKSVYYWLDIHENESKISDFEKKYYTLLEKYNNCLEEKEKLKSFRNDVVIQSELNKKD